MFDLRWMALCGALLVASASGRAGVLEPWRRASSAPSGNLNAVAFDRGRWVAVGDGGTLVTSTNGLDWHPGTGISTSVRLTGIAGGNGLWIAVGDRWWFRSGDGEVWEQHSSGTNVFHSRVVYGDGKWMILGSVGYRLAIHHSADGITWPEPWTNGAPNEPLFGIDSPQASSLAFGEGRWVVSGNSNPRGILSTWFICSSDGRHWTNGELAFDGGSPVSINVDSVAHGDWGWRASGFGFGFAGMNLVSTNGIVWRVDTAPQNYTMGTWMEWGGGAWLSVVRSMASAVYTLDPAKAKRAWSTVYVSEMDGPALNAAAYGAGRWVVVGAGGTILCRATLPMLTVNPRQPDGVFRATVTGSTGVVHRILVSTNLVDWSEQAGPGLGSVASGGALEDPSAVHSDRRFFRTVTR